MYMKVALIQEPKVAKQDSHQGISFLLFDRSNLAFGI